MTPLHLRPSTLDEIVFEGRNKAYGAFDLRQNYPTHVRRALGIALLLFLVLAAAPMVVRYLMPADVVVEPPVLDDDHPLSDVTTFKKIIEVKPVQPVAVKPVPTVALATKVVHDEQARPQQPEPAVIPKDVLFGATTNLTNVGDVPTDGLEETGPAGPGNGPAVKAPEAAAPPVLLIAERMPKYAGGEAAMIEFLRRNMRYPGRALRDQIEGKVFVSFTVAATGQIVDVQVLKGLGFGTDEEALRVVQKMPAWEPGFQNGHPVAVRYTLPITFRIGE